MEKFKFSDLIDIVERLRAPGGCPWDREQTHNSIRENLIEEAYELLEAIDEENGCKMADESGDVLLQVALHACIAKEAGEYDIDDVTTAICEKLIRRHPHVFGNLTVTNTDEVLDNWDAIKRQEKNQSDFSEELAGVCKHLPALMYCYKVQKKLKKYGMFEQKIKENILDTKNLLQLSEKHDINNEELVGRLLFDIVSLCGDLKINPELVLKNYTQSII